MALAFAAGKEALPDYPHRFAPKVFTQPQLFACLALKTFFNLDYRSVESLLRDFPGIGEVVGLTRVPDHSTLAKAAQRILGAGNSDKLLAATVRMVLGRRKLVPRAAADSTGLVAGHRSPYFVRRRDPHGTEPKRRTYRCFPKLTLLIDCRTHAALSLLTARGPRPDVDELRPLLARLPRGVVLLCLAADAGFDSEPNHTLLRSDHGIRGLIPAKHGRPGKTGKPPAGHWRRLMKRLLRTKRRRRKHGYTQRAQAETSNSMIKRNLTDELTSRSFHAQNRELRLIVLTHNLMILVFE
jgi:hypothetical protein